MSDKPKTAMAVYAAPEGGFCVSNAPWGGGEYSMTLAAFSTLREALAFIEKSMTEKLPTMDELLARQVCV